MLPPAPGSLLTPSTSDADLCSHLPMLVLLEQTRQAEERAEAGSRHRVSPFLSRARDVKVLCGERDKVAVACV